MSKTREEFEELLDEAISDGRENATRFEWGSPSVNEDKSRDAVLTAYGETLTRAEQAEASLKAANVDAERLANELLLEQNPGYTCEALRLHNAHLKGGEK